MIKSGLIKNVVRSQMKHMVRQGKGGTGVEMAISFYLYPSPVL